MKAEFHSRDWADFRQRYQGTFGWYTKEDGVEVMVRVDEVSAGETKFVNAEGGEHYAWADKGNVFTFLPIEKGIYNFNEDVVFCKRIPARQWRRGLHTANTQIESLESGQKLPITFDVLQVVFGKNNLSTTGQAIANWKAKRRSCVAFNTVFGVANKTLYLWDNNIGAVDKERFILNNNLFEQEVNDLVRDLSLNFIVEVKK